MEELITWLKAQLDERIARAASVGPWKVAKVVEYPNIGGCDAIVDDANDQHVIPPDVDYGPSVELADCEHIVRHDPVRVLREVEAKRRILDDFKAATAFSLLPDTPGTRRRSQTSSGCWLCPFRTMRATRKAGGREPTDQARHRAPARHPPALRRLGAALDSGDPHCRAGRLHQAGLTAARLGVHCGDHEHAL